MKNETIHSNDYNYNSRSEVTGANAKNTESYQYVFEYDNIGNRISALENETNKSYTTNSLNQYTHNTGFSPMHDLDGNQTQIKTSTGEWNVEYNGENRPIKFTQGDTVISMSYDYMGRRTWMAHRMNHAVAKEHRYFYDGYLLAQEMNADNTLLKEFTWDPTETTATKPLMMRQTIEEKTLFYTHDGNKNVSEVISSDLADDITHYEYSPFGVLISSSGSHATENPFRFSSEYYDDPLGLLYYNYRHYNPLDGRWLSRDPIEEKGGYNLYAFVKNNLENWIDLLGTTSIIFPGDPNGNNSDNGIIIPKFEHEKKCNPEEECCENDSCVAAVTMIIVGDAVIIDPTDAVAPVKVIIYAVLLGTAKAIDCYMKEHTKNISKKNWDKHTNPRPGRETEKKRQDPTWKDRSGKRRCPPCCPPPENEQLDDTVGLSIPLIIVGN